MNYNEDYWVFGYGSLLWKVDFPYEEKIPGYVKGFERRFWQNSIDHRGIPGKPGRVVTLIENSDKQVWGIAYKISNHDKIDVIKHLDHREKQGYECKKVLFHPRDHSIQPFHLNIYIGTPDNPDFAGESSSDVIANIIVHSEGPSGKNIEYFLNLVNYVKAHLPEDKDEHLLELEALVLQKANNIKVQA